MYGSVTGMLGACAAASVMPGMYEYLEPASAEPYCSCASLTCSESSANAAAYRVVQPRRRDPAGTPPRFHICRYKAYTRRLAETQPPAQEV